MKIVILGDGLLGTELANQTNWDIISRNSHGLDFTDISSWYQYLVKYDVIINCIANTDSYSKDKTAHWGINYKSVVRLCNWCNEYDKKLVHISTEFVYANNKIHPSEEDIPCPDNTWYAYTKLLADEYIQLCNSNYLICRELHKPKPFPYDKVWKVQTSGDTVDKIANLIIQLINKKASGVFNVGTGDKWLKELAPKSCKQIPPPFRTPNDTRMSLIKLNKFLNENNI
jgi:dTDP-4-dehydrorhamnose reductase